jgi:pimeloyl-ACP methyl ester carboxylesterase
MRAVWFGFGATYGRGALGLRLVAAGLLASVLTPAAAPAGTPAPTFVPQECWWPIPATLPTGTQIGCGTVDVPADRADPAGGTITLAVARIHREGADSQAPPILVLHGGPGGNALSGVPAGLASLDALAERDLIAFDQRGSGRSLPSLECPEKEEAILRTLGGARSFRAELRANRKAVKACRKRLLRAGIDLDDYHTLASVADMETLREAFGVETWNLFGGSYGTRLGLAYAREHPERVRSLLLDSVYPPEVGGVERWRTVPSAAIARLVEACAADAACQAAYGDLGALIDQAVASFDEQPERVDASFAHGGESITRRFELTGTDVRAALFSGLYQTALIPILPGVVRGLADGERGIIPLFIGMGVPQLLQLSEGAYYSIECADAQRLFDRREARRTLRNLAPDALVTVGTAEVYCPQWKVESVPASFNEPVSIDVPTLVLAGTLDPITPHADSEAQAARMPNARFVSVPRGGHGEVGFSACTLAAVNGFWHDPAAELPECLGELEPIPFTGN